MPTVYKVALLIETSNRYGRDLLYGVRDWVQKNGEQWSIRFTEQARRASGFGKRLREEMRARGLAIGAGDAEHRQRMRRDAVQPARQL